MLNPVVSDRNGSVETSGSSSLDVSGLTVGFLSSCASDCPEYDVEPKLAEVEVVVGDSANPWVRFGGGPNSAGSRREDRGAD